MVMKPDNPRRLVLATKNRGKVNEISALLRELPVEILTAADYPALPAIVEDGETFAANAIKKARTVADFTGEIALADDSGLEVDYLQGAPGVHTARFAGPSAVDSSNIEKLLGLLQGVPMEKRGACFKCVIAIAVPRGGVFMAEGSCAGKIAFEPQGGNGFGYDPVFYLPEYQKTFAQLDEEVKNMISHRGRALQQAKKILLDLFALR